MKKIALAVLVGLAVTGCANTDVLGGDVYTEGQAKAAQNVTYGRIVTSRPVKIQAESSGVVGTVGGGVIGGVAGSAIGGGTGKAIASAIGAVAGAVVGNQVEQKVNQANALELEIKKDDGQTIVVVQKYDAKLVPGARVRIVGNSKLNVSAM